MYIHTYTYIYIYIHNHKSNTRRQTEKKARDNAHNTTKGHSTRRTTNTWSNKNKGNHHKTNVNCTQLWEDSFPQTKKEKQENAHHKVQSGDTQKKPPHTAGSASQTKNNPFQMLPNSKKRHGQHINRTASNIWRSCYTLTSRHRRIKKQRRYERKDCHKPAHPCGRSKTGWVLVWESATSARLRPRLLPQPPASKAERHPCGNFSDTSS